MGRPTTEKKERMVKLRLSEEMYEGIMKRGDNVSESIRELIREGCTTEKKGEKSIVPQKNSEVEHRLTQYGAAYGLSGEGLATALMDAMDTGEIVYEDGRFRADSEYNFGKFVEACEQKGLDVQKMVDKCAQMIWG